MMGFNHLMLTLVTYTLTIGKFLKICFVLFAIYLCEFKLRYFISEASYFMKDISLTFIVCWHYRKKY